MTTPAPLRAADTAPIPPQNLEAEESVLGAMMISPGAIAAVSEILKPNGSDFYRESHARVYKAALALAAKGEPVDAITLVDHLEESGTLEPAGGRQRIHELAALVPATANAAHYARIVREMAQLRGLIRAGNEVARLGWERPGETVELLERARQLLTDTDTAGATELQLEPWAAFERSAATETIPTLVDGLWPEGGFGFVAAPPKKGKTWVGLDLAIAVATGTPFLSHFHVPTARPVVLLALEGHRAAIRGRIGALTRGHNRNPDHGSNDLANLHILYKPRGINLNDPAWVRRVRQTVDKVSAQLVIVDVLRAAAALKENSNDEFSSLLATLQPLAHDGVAIALLHHFGKLTELSRERTPGERMSGAGAMYGAMDVGVFITASSDGARTLRVEFEARDLSSPNPLGIHLSGETNGENGGFVYTDTATWIEQDPADADDIKAPAEEIADYIRDQGGDVERKLVEAYFGISDKTLARRLIRLRELGVELLRATGRGRPARLVASELVAEDDQLSLSAASAEPMPVLPGERTTRSLGVNARTPSDSDSERSLAQPSGRADHSERSESGHSERSDRTENPDLQDIYHSERSDSPTESDPPADATGHIPNGNESVADPWDDA